MSVFEISLYDKHRKCFAHFTSGKLLSGRDESGVFICSLMCKAHVPQKVSACGLINDCGKSPNLPPRSGRLPPIMANHLELLTELQQLDKVPSLERLRAAQKRRTQQLKRWAVYEKEMQNKKRKADKRRGHGNLLENRKRVSFSASVALLEASARNDPDEVRYLLKNNLSPDLCNEDGLTALHQCCIDNYEDMVRILLAHGATVNAQDNELWTPLHAAATGADLLAVNSDGNMPYDLCEDDPTLDIIETAMANRGITQEMINETRAAVERKMLGDIQNLLQDGADINQHDSQGATLVHVAELLVSHGANLNAKTYMEETPIVNVVVYLETPERLLVCEVTVTSADLETHETQENGSETLICVIERQNQVFEREVRYVPRKRQTGLTIQKVVRRASLSDRHNLCRKEYQTEAIVWRGGREEEERERESDQENSHSTQPNDAPRSPGILKDGRRQNGTISSAPAPTASNGDPVTPDHRDPDPSPSVEEPKSKDRPQTLSELKKQRAAAKLLTQPVLNGHLGNGSTKASPEDPRMPLVSSNGSAVYFTPASGDPPLLRFKQPIEDDDPKTHSCCCVS
ncbi:phosphatase 1 regulatory inhibitor subunit 16B [Labeo rohita]|uniref:Phosphatase 1 regulatory inhibitor subunit 16B n=1 Tax=Labeo rohita TaxID=84645 RepID=A0A498N994_LABRO|nr:phosphatase 1 regulatory inhibitor subunit 16B [Labeo rohita]